MILSSETNPSDANQMLAFYKQYFEVVELVTCGQCGSMLCFECFGGDGMGIAPNELGKYIIPIGDNLLSHRVRLDEAPTGERMVGYQCGAPVPNPEYPNAKKIHEENLAAYEIEYETAVKAAEKQHKKAVAEAKKQKVDEPEYLAPKYMPPQFPAVPETIPCGNDTRIADIERGLVPVGATQTALSPFEKHQIREKIRSDKRYKPNFRKRGTMKQFDTFNVERV